MLLAQDFYKTFIGDKEIADTKKTSAALLCINFDSKDEVDRFADMAVENGGRKHVVKVSGTEEFMYNYEVEDLDGHTWEPMYMDVTKFTGA
jgi:predicted lactoylglutathione lyase